MIGLNPQLTKHKIIFDAPILSGVQLKKQSSYGRFESAPLDVIDLNGNGKADQTESGVTKPLGKTNFHSIDRLDTTEPTFTQPSLTQLRNYAAKIGAKVLTKEELPNGLIIGESFAEGVASLTAQGTTNQRPVESLLYQVCGEIKPNANWALDLEANRFVIYEKLS